MQIGHTELEIDGSAQRTEEVVVLRVGSDELRPERLAFLLRLTRDSLFEVLGREGECLGYSSVADFAGGRKPR